MKFSSLWCHNEMVKIRMAFQQMQKSLAMNKIRHKIAAALALFGVLVPVALAQTVGGTANIEIVERGPSITTVRNVLLGQFFRPRTGTATARRKLFLRR